jgi:hypothetical protein
MKICILILSTNNESYNCFKYAIRSTWLDDFKNNSIDCFFYEGGSDKNKIIGDTIYLSVKDELKYTFYKFYICLKYLKSINKDYDLFFRANLSCYIDVFNFFEFINNFNIDSNSYYGKIGVTYLMSELTLKYKLLRKFKKNFNVGKKIKFYSGAGFFIGCNKVEYILKYGHYFKNDLIIDDVLIGLILFSNSISTLKDNIFKVVDVKIDSGFKLSENELFDLITNNFLFFYRFKNYNRIKDCEYLLKFGNPYIRKHLLLNGFDDNQSFNPNNINKFNLENFKSPLFIKKNNILLDILRLLLSYFKVLFFVQLMYFKKLIKHNLILFYI